MVQEIKMDRKTLARNLRKKGYSYSDIKKVIPVPKSTLSHWLRNFKLTEVQLAELNKRKLRAVGLGAKKRIEKTKLLIENIQRNSSKDIKEISKRELWLMGIMLYWRERFLNKNESDLKKGVRFTSSDPSLIKLFLRWLKEIGRLGDDEIDFDIFIGEYMRNEIGSVVNYWAKLTGFPKANFSHVYYQKTPVAIKKRKREKSSHFGLLKIRVKASSLLARQISGWIRGIEQVIQSE